MKKIISLFVLIVYATVLFAGDNTIKQTIVQYKDGKTYSFAATWFLKNDKLRLDIAHTINGKTANTVILPDVAANMLKMYVVGGKEYYAVNGNIIQPEISANKSVTITAETKKIGEYNCKKAITTLSNGNEVEFWFTEDIKFDNVAVAKLVKSYPALNALAMQKINGFVLEMTEKDARGLVVQKISFETQNAENLSDMIFVVPPDYKLYTSGTK